MDQIKLKANIRKETGKEVVKKLRADGRIPAVVYHRGEEPLPLTVPAKELSGILRQHAGENILISLTVEDDKKKKPRAVIIKEIQHDPVKRGVLHVDFNEISLTEKITVEVEIVAVGDPIGVKQDGGSLEHILRELKVKCLPTDIPKHIDVDVSGLKLNDAVHVRDVKVSDKLEVLNDPELIVLQVKKHEEKVEDETAVAPELEVIREKKEDDAAKPGEAKAAEKEAKPEKK